VVAFVSTLLGQAEVALATAFAATAPHTAAVTVACAISEQAHHDEAPSIYTSSCYSDFCSNMRHRLGTSSILAGSHVPEIRVTFAPLVLIPIGDATFVLPAAGAAPSAGVAGGYALGYGGVIASMDSDGEEEGEEEGAELEESWEQGRLLGINKPSLKLKPRGVAVLAHTLAHVAAALGVRPEAFCLGPAARAVGKSLFLNRGLHSFLSSMCSSMVGCL